MDFLKKAASEFNSKNENQNQNQDQNQDQGQNNVQTQQNNTTTTEGQNTSAPTTNNTQSQDYGDKAFDFISKKAGHDLSPEMDEKITDGLRTAYESYSGKKVDSKYSN